MKIRLTYSVHRPFPRELWCVLGNWQVSWLIINTFYTFPHEAVVYVKDSEITVAGQRRNCTVLPF